ncbi:hypothetical protein Pan216_57020 [Planctomycetes bacterium Pan216]|uniref:Tetratricopeptide repeat protein n=1 Tax=Kolteria novifilia TaxID=2527975 RepID=A0A518BCX2_9BACT|nr:hypothetical protein Pan216_57020 [Planctomycetes bacterium Pan216]
MDNQSFDDLSAALETSGADGLFDKLVSSLEKEGDYAVLFEALLMKIRHELGLPLVQTGLSGTVPKELESVYEQKVIEACRHIGQCYIDAGDLSSAFQYCNMVGEFEPLREAIENVTIDEDDPEAAENLIEIAVTQGVHPQKGLALILDYYGTCQAITACEGIINQGTPKAARDACVRLLVQRLHEELTRNLAAVIEDKEGSAPAAASVPLLLKDRAWLFDNDNYHIDTSHLSSVVRMARLLEKCQETFLAIQLCEYGRRLSEQYRYPEAAPFEDIYEDSLIYLRALAGIEINKGVEHFLAKAERSDPMETGIFPWQVAISLLQAAGRVDEAVALARSKMNRDAGNSLQSPVNQLCQETGQFTEMADLARRRGDLVSYAAALLQRETTDSKA